MLTIAVLSLVVSCTPAPEPVDTAAALLDQTQAELDSTKTDLENTQQQLESTQADLETAQASLEDKENQIQKLEDENASLQAKVEEAAPFFALSEEEQKKTEKEAKKMEEERLKEEAEEAEAKKQEELEAKSVTFGAGNYVAGKDFEAGTYNLIAVKNGGNVFCLDSGLNEIMGTGDPSFYIEEYNNASFSTGAVLEISGSLKLKLVPVE